MTSTLTRARIHSQGIDGLVSGAVLRTYRRRLQLNQQAIADQLGVDLNTYRAWESGRRSLSRVSVVKFKALSRGLVDIGVPRSAVGVLDTAIELDIDIVRALASEENLFPPPGCTETWRALLQWSLGGPAPVVFLGWRQVEPPRFCPADQRLLMARAGWELGG
jgi:transcriptional regulator with XRE-family HTH domain